MPFERKLEEIHHLFIRKCMASFVNSPTTIVGLLASAEVAESSGFPVVEISTGRISQIITANKADEKVMDELETMRAEYLLDFTDLPLYHQKERVKILEARFHAVRGDNTKDNPGMKGADGKKLPDSECLGFELKILKQIAEEAGENLEKIARALAAGRSVHLDIKLGDRILGHYRAPINEPERAETDQGPVH